MTGAIESRIAIAHCGCEENEQLQHRNHSLQKRLQYLTDLMGENENELISLMERNEALHQKNYHLEGVNKKLRQDVEILEGSHQLQADIINNAVICLSKPFRKDEPTEKEISDAEVQTEDCGHLEDECTVDTNIESATQKIARLTERLEKELEAKQALQAEYDLVKADQQKFLLRVLRDKQEIEELEDLYRKATEQNEKLRNEIENQRLVTFGSKGVLDQTFRSLDESFEEAIAKQNEDDQMIVDVQKKQGRARTCGCLKPSLLNTSKSCLRCRILVFRSTVRAFTDFLFSIFQK